MDSQSELDSLPPANSLPSRSRAAARFLILAILAVIVVETAPRQIPGVSWLRQKLSPALRATGLWQGQWTLFAPNPVLNNGWVSAEIYHRSPSTDEEVPASPITWNSPYWGTVGNWEKFYRFRHLNYFNRLPYRDQTTADDFADFLCRELVSAEIAAQPMVNATDSMPLRKASELATAIEHPGSWPASEQTPLPEHFELRLSHNDLRLIMPEDGTFPLRGDEMWMAAIRNMTIRKYLP